jgi:chitodextrinase/C1A family cysteine protease
MLRINVLIGILACFYLSSVPNTAYTQPVKGIDRLKAELAKYNTQEFSISSITQKGQPELLLKDDQILVVNAPSSPSSGYVWEVEKYDGEVIEMLNVPLSDAYEPCPMPGATISQRILFVGKGKGTSDVRLVYRRPWDRERTIIQEYSLRVNSDGAFNQKFTFEPTKSNVKELKAEDYVVKSLPVSFDWRTQGVVTPVKDQGATNGCWSFGSAAGFEAKIKKKDGIERDLSEQFLCACNPFGYSASGGGWWAHDLWWNYVPPGDNGAGAVYESDFPYQYKDVDCTPHNHYEQLEGWAYTDDVEDTPWPSILHDPTVAQVKQKLYDWGPIPTALCVDNWGSYTGGVLTTPSTSTATNHIVLITGWDDVNQCWIIKNSWGTGWGEAGYIRIKYGNNLVGQYSTYLKYDKVNPRIVYQGELFYEQLANDGSIRKPIELRLFNAGDFKVTSGSMTQGVHYTIAGVPAGLTSSIVAIDSKRAKVVLAGKATSHLNANDAQITVSFLNAAFSNGNAANIENSTYNLNIDFFDPYKIVYENIDDQTVTPTDVWKSWIIDGKTNGLWYSYYYDDNNNKVNTFFYETYCKKVMCTTSGIGTNERMVKALNYGDIVDPLTEYWVLGGDLGKQHRITNASYTVWNGKTAYAGIQFNKYGGTCYGWVRFQVNAAGTAVTVLDYAYNEEPFAPIRAGYSAASILQPVADFDADVNESYTGVDIYYTDKSLRNPASWSWSFPGATPSTSTERNPRVKYAAPGTYNVTLTVTNSAGTNTKTKTGIITIYQATAPVANFTPAATTVPRGAKVLFTDNSTNRPTAWQWTFNGGSPGVSTERNGSATFISNGTYPITLQVSNPYGSNSITKTITVVEPPSGGYCSAITTNTTSLHITNVSLANLNHSSSYTAGGYENHTSQFAALDKASQYTITVELNNPRWTYNALGIWIDWNQDKDFDDAGETIYTMNNGSMDYDQVFTVPLDAISGMTRMRVRAHYSKDPYPCGEDTHMGETEDYTIIVNGTSPVDTQPPSAPANLVAGSVTTTSIALSWSASTDNVGVTDYDVYKGASIMQSVTGTSCTITGLSCGTSYTFTVKAKDAAGNISLPSNSVTQNTSACPDTQAPTAPTNLAASNVTQTGCTLSWTASTDNVGVTGYEVFRGSSSVGTTATTTFTVTGLTASTTYNFTVKARDAAGNVSAASNAISVTTLNNTATYCTSQGNSQTYEWIASVKVGAYTKSSGASKYSDFTGTPISITTGGNSITLTPGFSGSSYSEYWAVWIDLNNNQSFADAGELVYSGSGASALNGTITIPASASGTARMRVSMKYGSAPTACETFAEGEVEDYSVAITGVTPDTQAPSAPTNLAATNITQTSCVLNWTASTDNVGVTGYEVFRGSSSVGTTATTTFTVTGLTANTTYSFTVKARDAAGNVSSASNAVSVTTLPPVTTYCDATHGSPLSYFYIQKVIIGSINNTSTLGNTSTGYSNYTTTSTTLRIGSTYQLSVHFTPGWAANSARAYIDWNADGDFDDSNETVLNASGATSPYSSNLTVPSTAKLGSTRMRVRLTYNGAITPCGALYWGETEDYSVIVSNTSGTTGVDTQPFSVNVFPNPASDRIYIILDGVINAKAQLVRIDGSIARECKIENSNGDFDIRDLPAGLYFVKVSDQGNYLVCKVVIAK